ncbi:endosome/lysosome-associated apoptosis and autophagy regulator 1 isoform X1 [Callorhinchus milii]|uniref:endosome/lysosome-associated apoptosis and autophagy regulator 1 isoform X1 n=1 Tax=Callorhinchus milii TaxID=7868 RepID=UPI001C3FA3C5|nr:endosome/lysosome-associated apoptosis and autophagy regulator 1 isoform X1 [Callorhinchus milii]
MRNQSCKACIAGTYSLGTGVEFSQWDELPPGFINKATTQDMSDEFTEAFENCTTSKWTLQTDFIASNTDECRATLMYSVYLKQPGTVSFEYLYPDTDIFFEFFVQNDQCQAMDSESKGIRRTERNDWQTISVHLNRGNNVLYWRTTGFPLGNTALKPALIKNIFITGVAYTSECFPCKPGSCNNKAGSSRCDPCPRNTYSPRGATFCQACDKDSYSETGSGSCKKRQPCSAKDYFNTHTPCDSGGMTQIMYKWIEPKLCNEDAKDAVKLPASGTKEPCRPCNPGFFKANGTGCEPCPHGFYSDGSTECTKCAIGTEPVLGFEYKWWNSLPKNMDTACFNGIDEDCKEIKGWEVAGDHVQSAVGRNDNDFLMLILTVPGFRAPESVVKDTENAEIARITFVFETKCTADCELYFMVGTSRATARTAEIWSGSRGKQSYTYVIEKHSSLAFVWAFQRTTSFDQGQSYSTDVAQIYSINVTNVRDGVSSYCRPCALEDTASGSACVACPLGHYIDKASSKCRECPPNTYLKAHHYYGKESCVPCGPGTRSSLNHTLCYNDCKFAQHQGSKTLQYDFSLLSNVSSVTSAPRFTSKGVKYFHYFNIGLCGFQGKKMATCVDNVTVEGITEAYEGFTEVISSYICQSTLVPTDVRGFRTITSSHPINLADRLLGVTSETTLENLTADGNLFPVSKASRTLPDIIYFYRSSESTETCKTGRASTIRLRCNPAYAGSGTISVPSGCQEGTCDGCTFHFLWETAEACPLCSATDYHEIVGACVSGIQKTAFVWWEPKLCKGGVELPEQTVETCKAVDFFLKIGIITGSITACLLVATTCYFYKKNQKLEYKYCKLVMNSNVKDGELPAVDSCAIMEGEDMEDDLIFMSKKSLFGKIKSFTTKRTSEGFDCVPLKSSSESADLEL